ncbi:MAG TPA: primosomal protein N' [Bacillota bacterium]|nr:primosomal protein N' [Bacillota bacterium]
MPRYAEVIVDVSARRVDKPFHYYVDEEIDQRVCLGSRVLVPFGRRQVEGYVVGFVDEPDVDEVKPILDVVDPEPVFTEEQLQLAEWMSEHYLCLRVDALQCILPAGAKRKGSVSIAKKQIVELVDKTACQENDLTPKQRAVVAVLSAQPDVQLTPRELMEQASVSSSVIQTLVKKGILRKKKVEVRRTPSDRVTQSAPVEPVELTDEQASAVAAIEEYLDSDSKSRSVLLHGVTGSGKTEVYIRAAAAALDRGKQVIVLVPEIALTSQIVERFGARFGDDVAVFHSGLSLGERFDEWRRIGSGEASIVIGARSAVFAPLSRLGLIIIDEEHEPSYKQDDAPRYHAREVAEKRAELTGAVLVLGSATPSLETYYRSEQGLVERHELPVRVCGHEMPTVHIVDMREEQAKGNRTIFSDTLRAAMARHLEHGGQIILFLNRRGHSTFVLCRECGYAMRCRHCDVALTYHSSYGVLRCHYCDFKARPPDICPKCKGRQIGYFGIGTERVVSEIAKDFPGTEVVRLDVDTARRKDAHRNILERFRQGEARILVGTQMVAKGLDYPNVSLVGVVSADTSLNIPDFRSAERTFQLILQVAGRAGRSPRGGEVVVQTYCPDHYSIVAAAAGDYQTFYRQELEIRRETGYPPFSRVISLLFQSVSERTVMRSADRVCALLRDRLSRSRSEVQVLGPSPAPLVKVKDQYRWYVWLKGTDMSDAMQLLNNVILHVVPRLKKVGVTVTITVDPMSMM